MLGVVEEGTGASAAVEGYAVGGKTGTAEKLPRGNGKYLVSFIGYAPVSYTHLDNLGNFRVSLSNLNRIL